MINARNRIRIAIISFCVALACGVVWAGVEGLYKDDFDKENAQRIQERKEVEEQVRKEKEAEGKKVNVIVEDDEPGITGLKVSQILTKESSLPQELASITFSTLKSAGDADHSIESEVVSIRNKALYFTFKNGLPSDPGYVSDAFWMENVLIMKLGRYSAMEGYYLYALDENKKVIFRVSQNQIHNETVLTSPSNKFMTYIINGGTLGADSEFSGPVPLELWIWDLATNQNAKIASSNAIQGSCYWKSATQLIYSVSEGYKEGEVSSSYIYNPISKQSELLLKDCQAPVFSPDGNSIVYATRINTKKGFSKVNCQYVLKNLASNSITPIDKKFIGTFDLNRQIVWSADSKIITSILNNFSPVGYRLFIFDVTTKTARSLPIIPRDSQAKILGISKYDKTIYILQKRLLDENLNAIGESNWRFTISAINSSTGSERILWAKDRILSLSSRGITLSQYALSK